MTHPETAIAALFDHEQELDAAGAPRSRRPAPDWGGDDLFSSTPRRRRPRQRTRDIGEHHLYAVPAPDEIEWSGSAAVATEPPSPSEEHEPPTLELVAEPTYTETPPP